MKKIALILIAVMFLFSGCLVPPGQVKKQSAPGQIKKATGVHPLAGKKSKKGY
jgi:starvation-inducible outer membrane lipoprotein